MNTNDAHAIGRSLNIDRDLAERLYEELGDNAALLVADFAMGQSIATGKDFIVTQTPHPQVAGVWLRHVSLRLLGEGHEPVLKDELVTSKLTKAGATTLCVFWCRAYGIKGVR